MKTARLTTTVKTAMIIVVTILALAINTKAQTVKNTNPVFTENAIKSLIIGIHDDVEGIKKACIYMAGQYRLKETVNDLVSQLEDEQNPKLRVLISVSLLRIGEEKGIRAVYRASLSETNAYAVHMFKSVVHEYYTEKNQSLSMK